MENKRFKALVSNLEKVASGNRHVTDLLLEKLQQTTMGLVEIIEENNIDGLRRFDFKNYGFRVYASQHDRSIEFCHIDEYGLDRVIPYSTNYINGSSYLHGDINCEMLFAGKEEALGLCEIIDEFIENMVDVLAKDSCVFTDILQSGVFNNWKRSVKLGKFKKEDSKCEN